MTRRHLLSAFLAAPVVVRFAPAVKPSPMTLAAFLDSLPVETELAVTSWMLAAERTMRRTSWAWKDEMRAADHFVVSRG